MAATFTEQRFFFTIDTLPAAAFGVVRFQGNEGLSRCYAFEVALVSEDAAVDLAAVVQQPAHFTIRRDDGTEAVLHGIVTGFEQLDAFGGAAFYQAHLSPRLHRLSLTCHDQVFLGRSVPEFVADCLIDGGLTAADFTFRLQHDYPPLDYVCQYDESHLAFVTRWLARAGMYYYFEQGGESETMVITDSRLAHAPLAQGARLRYAPPSGLETAIDLDEAVFSWTCRRRLTPAAILVKDANYRKPALDVSGEAAVNPAGRGRQFIYGAHVRTPEQAQRAAAIHADAVRCTGERFHGAGASPFQRPGFTFTLTNHFNDAFNQDYLTLDVDHEGSQTGYLVDGLWLGEDSRDVFYRNRFTAIAAGMQFRPAPDVPWPRIAGTLPATVDAAGTGAVAELDHRGRYKVILPFDLSGRKDGKASTWLRMATPYAGDGHGMHFPLHKGTEVILAFIDGDPDRPVIIAAVPNAETRSVVTGDNQTMAAITTAGGNRIHIEDKAGSERILMHVPKQESFIRVGAHNDPPPGADDYRGGHVLSNTGIAQKTKGAVDIAAKGKNALIIVESTDAVLGVRTEITAGALTEINLGGRWEVHQPDKWACKNFAQDIYGTLLNEFAEDFVVTKVRSAYGDVLTRICNNATTAAGTRVAAMNKRIEAVDTKVETVGDDIETLEEDIATQATDIRLTGNGILAFKETLKSVGTHLKTAGTQIATTQEKTTITGLDIQEAGTHVASAGTVLKKMAGLSFEN